MPEHFGLDADLKPWRADVHFIPDHSGRPVPFRRREILVAFCKRRDIDRETVESLCTVTDGQGVRHCPDAMQNRMLRG